jgi:hypothetical protein
LKQFPTTFHSEWQWEDILKNSRSLIMDELPAKLRPIVQIIDDWNTNRRLGLVFECRIGQGKLVVCTADLVNRLEQRPAARQLRTSLLSYMTGADFKPQTAVESKTLIRLLTPQVSHMVELGARIVSVDSEDTQNGHLAAHAIDGKPETIWHTQWTPDKSPMPHTLVIDLGREVAIAGITCLPRQDMSNGQIARCEIYCSNSPNNWTAPVAKPHWENTDRRQTVKFPTAKARYVKLLITEEVNRNPFAAVAELDIIPGQD